MVKFYASRSELYAKRSMMTAVCSYMLMAFRNLELVASLDVAMYTPAGAFTMKQYQTLSYNDVRACIQSPAAEDGFGFTGHAATDKAWGRMEEHWLCGDHYHIAEIKADLTGTFRIGYQNQQMLRSMNICAALDGQIALHLQESGVSAMLHTRQHHAVHSCETAYTLTIPNAVHVIHLAVDRDYYINLLCEQECWTARLKESLLNKEQVVQGDAVLGTEMLRVLQGIRHNPLQGNLKKLLIEAKILELMALQLVQFSTRGVASSARRSGTLRPADVDTFHALRDYLDVHFASDLSLRSLARTFGVNEFKLKRGFKELFQTTVFDYVHTCRMNHARHLLADQKMYVHAVAGIVGYKNANHFSTAFRRTFGISPTEAG